MSIFELYYKIYGSMNSKLWNWQKDQWPNFSYDIEALKALEYQFSENNGVVLGVLKHINKNSKDDILIEILSDEALKTSEIEGEYLDRSSIQSSIKHNLGLSEKKHNVTSAEFGISEMMVDLYLNHNQTLSHQQLFEWHKMITNGRRDLTDIGRYRTHKEAMVVVSGRLDQPTIHFEAPPSENISIEMERFIDWFNSTHSPNNKSTLLPLVKSGIAHLYFVCIHPFEDGNGRIGRAIAEKSIALSTNKPALIALSNTIEANRNHYYSALENNNKTLEITDWLVYFAQTILEAQQDTIKRIDFIIEKARFFDQYSSEINQRQLKVIQRLFNAGHTGFIGGLSADNYTKIAKTSASTATRDLADLVKRGVFIKTGQLKGTRYALHIKSNY
jgi:Fic family protein